MKDKNIIDNITTDDYKYGFTTNVQTDIIPVGLNEDVVRLISSKKKEPQWLLDFRLNAYRHWLTMKMPTWAKLNIPQIDYQKIAYFANPMVKKPKNIDEIDPELVKTFNRLGIPKTFIGWSRRRCCYGQRFCKNYL